MAQKPMDAGAELPLTEPSYLILLALAERPMHGYLIMQTINTAFRTGFQRGPGTLYRTLQPQLKAGLTRETDEADGNTDDPRPRYSSIPHRSRDRAAQDIQPP